MKNYSLNWIAAAMAVAMTQLTGCGGGSSTPNVNNHPTPARTVAEISGSVVKGTLANAAIEVYPLNATQVSIDTVKTDLKGKFPTTKITSAEGYAFNGLHRIVAVTSSGSSMVCDAAVCGKETTGQLVQGTELGDVKLKTLVWIKAGLGAQADGKPEADVQINALSTFASQLLEGAIAKGKSISAMESLVPAQLEYSTKLLRILGVDANNINLFTETLESADNAEALKTATNAVKLLSLLNGAFSGFADGEKLQTSMASASELIEKAAAGDLDAAISLRQRILDAWKSHPAITELGMDPTKLIDLKLPLVAEVQLSGPIKEYTTAERMSTATITARGAISDGEAPQKAFDGDTKTKWLDNKGAPTAEAPSWIQINYAEPVAINQLSITSANDADSRDPENFNIQASSDGVNWINLAQWAGASFTGRFQTQDFRFANSLAYSYYRVNITKNKGNDGLMQLAEIELFGPIFPDVKQSVSSATITARGFISEGENPSKVFDGDAKTKWLDNKGAPTAADPSWVQVDFAAPVAVGTLALTSANDAPSRDPENFQLLGSNDAGATWVTIGSWSGESFAQRYERHQYVTANGLAYKSYRVNITKNKGNDGLMQVGEIELIGPSIPWQDASDTAGVIVTARGAISENESPDKVFDNNTQTKWLDNKGVPSAAEPSWVQIQLPVAKVVNQLMITSANDAPSRDPENFNLQASQDGKYWVTLKSWAGVSFDTRFQRMVLPFINDVAFTYYRYNITKNKGNDSLMQIAEIELVGPSYQAQNLGQQKGAVIKYRKAISDGESGEKAMDGDANTKWLDNGAVPTAAEPAWISVALPKESIASTIAITSANDAPSRDIENFFVEGSSDGVNWTKIAEFAGLTFNNRFERQVFNLGNGRSFMQYRLNITKNKGNDGLTQVSEIELLGTQN